ncbi:MAG: hypothetical protein WCO06_06230 [Candidatus Roizmanbacteria bacterium]
MKNNIEKRVIKQEDKIYRDILAEERTRLAHKRTQYAKYGLILASVIAFIHIVDLILQRVYHI